MVQDAISSIDESRTYIQPSIKIYLLDRLELRLDLLPSSLHRKNRPLPHKEGLVKVIVDVSKVKSGHVQPVVSLITLLMASLVAFFCRASLTLPLLNKKGTDL